MTRYITQRELRNESAEVLRAVGRGQHLVVTRNGTPAAELSPVADRGYVTREELMEAAAILPRVDADAFRADLDAVVDDEVLPGE